MKTDDMIALLANNVAPIDRGIPARRYRQALLTGFAGATLLVLVLFGLRPDLHAMLLTPLFWAKLVFPLCLAAGALLFSTRLSRPGMSLGHAWAALALPLAVLWLVAAATLLAAAPEDRLPMILGETWRKCPFNIALLSIPVFAAIFWAVKGLAPTRLRAAGAMAGLLSGSVAALAYSLHCPEMGVAFWAVWYLAGILIPTLAGMLLGPRLLRW